MPKELRKRGKRAKKTREEDAYIVYAKPDEKAQLLAAVTGTEYTKKPTGSEEEPAYPKSRLDATPKYDQDEAYSNANSALLPPVAEESTSLWPAVDPDTKAYFKQLETQILEFEALHGDRLARKAEQAYENGGEEEVEEEIDDRVLLLRAALTQLSGNEASIAADPETSPILERLVYSMDDFARRVLIDRFTGQYSDIAQDRFASHVLQALIVLGGGETVERERRGVIATGPFDMGEPSGSTGTGQLPTMTECIVALTKEILKDLSTLVKSQQGSYIVRALLLVLAGKPLPFDSQSSSTSGGRQSAMARSKKSARWKAGRGAGGEMRSFISDENNAQSGTVFGKGKAPERRIVPKIFEETLDELLLALDRTLSGSKAVNSEIAQQALRIASDDPIATGLVQIMLEIESDKGRSEKQGSLMDRLLQGLITAQLNDTLPHQPPRSDYIETLLRSNISSHVLEKLISLCPEPIFDLLFKVYFVGRMGRLAGHPVANFVCARVMERANQEQTEIVVEEIPPALEGIIENSRTGVLKALLEKTADYKTGEEALNKALLDAFQTTSDEDIQYLIPCALSLMTLNLFKRNPSYTDPSVKAEMQLQGSLLLQSWLKLERNSVTTSLLALPIPRLISLASDPTASRVIDAFLDEDNKAVAYKDRRAFLRNLIGHYQTLSDDRIGSRVAERCWAVADPFLKDKIAESLIPYEMKMQGSYFGHYFARKVNLPLYKRNKYDWKDRQARGVGGTPAELRAQQSAMPPQRQPRSSAQQNAPVAVAPAMSTDATDSEKAGKKRRKARTEEADEIDQIFGGATKRGKLDAGVVA